MHKKNIPSGAEAHMHDSIVYGIIYIYIYIYIYILLYNFLHITTFIY